MKVAHRYILIISLFIIALLIPLSYYSSRLEGLLKNPSKFSDLFISAAGLRSLSINFLLINLFVFISAALIDLSFLGWQKSAIKRLMFKRNKSSKADLWCWFLSVFSIYDFFTLLFSMGLFYVISSVIVKAGGFKLLQFISIPWLQILALLILIDFKHYLWHRFMHFQPFWELHKYHHSATEFNLVTKVRGHFFERGFLIIFDSILFSLLGAPVEHFVFFLFIKEFYNQLLHSDINISLGWFGKYILVSPRAHRLHHSVKSEHHDKNFGNIFIFWDRLFGTYASTEEEITLGVENNQYNVNGFWWDMQEGSKAFGTASISSLKKFPRKFTGYFKK